MSKKIELEQLDRTIKDGDIRLKTIGTNIEILTREIDALFDLESQLIDNIKFLKQSNIIAMAAEFKKIKEDLARTVVRLVSLKNDRESFRKSIRNIEDVIKKSKESIENLKSGENNVVCGKFGKKKNG